ncbi:MAG: hypothetical protein R3C05_24055 [Pirellulaceae bacterium]
MQVGEVKKPRKRDFSFYLTTHENTAFAILFLIRSTKKAIVSVKGGTMQGGFGLPSALMGSRPMADN